MADKADLGREVRREVHAGVANGGRGGHTRRNERKVRARGPRVLLPFSFIADPLVFANCLEDVSRRYFRD